MRSRAAAPHSDPLGHREAVEHGPALRKALAAADSGDDATTPHLRLLSQLGGSTTSVALRGDMAYVGEGPRILVVALAGPSGGGVQRLGISAPLPGVVRGLAWSGDLLAAIYRDALANLGNDGLALFDVADPGQPKLLSLLPLEQGPLSLAAAGSRLFVTGHDAARGQSLAAHEVLLAVDAVDPLKPRVADTLVLREPGVVSPAPVPLTVLAAGDTLWLLRTLQAGATDETEVAAYASTSAPASGGQLRIRAAGRHAAAAADDARGLVHLVTVDPSRGRVALQTLAPRAATPLVGSLELVERRGCGGPLALQGQRAAYSRHLLFLDLVDPAAPRITADLPLAVAAGDLSWSGDRLVVSGGAMGGLLTVSVADATHPTLTGRLAGLGSVSRLAFFQGAGEAAVLYGSDPVAGLWAIDPAAAANPAAGSAVIDSAAVLQAPLLDLPRAADLVVADGRLVVGGWSDGLRPFDLATPSAPRALAMVRLGRQDESLATDGRRVYAGLGSAGLAALSFVADGSLQETARLEQPLIWQVDSDPDADNGGRLIGQGLGAFFALDPASLEPLRSWPAPPPDAFKVNRADSLAVDGDTLHLGVAAYTFNTLANSYSDRLMSLRLDTASGSPAAPAGLALGTIGSRAGRVLARDGLVMVAGDGQLTLLRQTADGPRRLDAWASPGAGSDLLRWKPDGADPSLSWICGGLAGCAPDLLFLADGEAGLAVLALETGAATPTPDSVVDRLWLPWLARRP